VKVSEKELKEVSAQLEERTSSQLRLDKLFLNFSIFSGEKSRNVCVSFCFF
jgi:hypothetical protein